MRHSLRLAATLLAALALPALASEGQEVREEIKKSLTLAPGAQVRISGINGGVTIETGEGSRAEIDIVVTASSREALERRPLVVEDTPNSLTIRTVEVREAPKTRGHVRHEVRLRLPRAIQLAVSSVNGSLDVGEIAGTVSVSSVNGGVRVAQAGTATEITSVNGRVSIALTALGEQGLRVGSINGGVELRLPTETNAEIEVRSVNGGIDTDFPMTVTGQIKRGELRGTLGSGGARIAITSVNGGVQLRRL